MLHVAGTGMTYFGRYPERGLESLAGEAVAAALKDAGVPAADVGMVFFANAAAGVITGQEMIRGQSALRETELAGTPIINVENACASGATAIHMAAAAVRAGQCDVAVAVGAEKLVHEDKQRSFAALASGVDLARGERLDAFLDARGCVPRSGSLFMDIYARLAEEYMETSGATQLDFARVAAKNHAQGALNPKAQYGDTIGPEEILKSRAIAGPITLLMCSPIGDGAAALVLCSSSYARRAGVGGVRILATALVSGSDDGTAAPIRAADAAYEQAGLGPEDVDLAEVHDAAAPAELAIYEELRLCEPGGGPALLASGATALGGRIPVNVSGGLISRGHPVGATGCAQVVELADQLRGRCGPRQVEGARIGLAQNAGGFLGPDHAAATVTILAGEEAA
jgi:acetyl-CoA acetyltransferase